MPIGRLLTAIIVLTCTSSALYGQADTLPVIHATYPPYKGFYTKLAYCYGIPIRADVVVKDSALIVAYRRIHLMLQNIPLVQKRLLRRGAELHIIGKDQQPSDLPELRYLKGKKVFLDTPHPTDVDERTRGVGDLLASCGEENLLNLPGDSYYSSDICVHEFAHDIMDNGLTGEARYEISRVYFDAMRKGLWLNNYAAVNYKEYFAELSMWYFGSHGAFLTDTMLPGPGSEGLRKYDPEGYQLMNDIYNHGKPITPRVPATTVATPVAKTRRTEKRLAFPSALTIFNNTDRPINVNWIDFDGKPQLYAIVKPRNHITQQTYTTHIWMLADPKQTLGYYEVNGIDCQIIVGGLTK